MAWPFKRTTRATRLKAIRDDVRYRNRKNRLNEWTLQEAEISLDRTTEDSTVTICIPLYQAANTDPT
ncbi:hypothetical protein LTR15_003695 [Elasticomyces elasticus]|nr:hypothetical protein LTR15_003695 [Elasticomyces elasticus]